MIRILAFLLLLLAPASAQVRQSGNVTPGHVPVWTTTGVISDSGTAASPSAVQWLTSIGVAAVGPAICQQTALNTAAAWTRICMGVNAAGVGRISLQGFGTAPVSTFQIVVDGTTYSVPGSGLATTIPDNTVLGNVSGGTAAPVGLPLTNCPDTLGNHVNFTVEVGFSCGTSIPTQPPTRPILTGNTPYYVRTDGNDACTGLVDASGSSGACAFATWQKCQNVVAALDNGGFAVSCNQGTQGAISYAAGWTCNGPYVGNGTVTFTGNAGTPSNVLISPTGASAITLLNGCSVTIGGFKLATTTSGFGISATDGVRLILSAAMNFGATAQDHMSFSRSVAWKILAGYTISGGAPNHITNKQNAAGTFFNNPVITLTGTPAFAGAFYNCLLDATSLWGGVTFSGAATGVKFTATTNCATTGTGAGANFPGNVAGTPNLSGAQIQ